ncbi:hypothetical protein B0H34DRAFT_720621 [Crassisporium funariophilum]|nr:hypothetical protein B0H34DRAFT_720621 [Crassisporium funariophilum]
MSRRPYATVRVATSLTISMITPNFVSRSTTNSILSHSTTRLAISPLPTALQPHVVLCTPPPPLPQLPFPRLRLQLPPPIIRLFPWK